MPAPRIRSEYDVLDQIAKTFIDQADLTNQSLKKLSSQMGVLQDGDWIGKGAKKFYKEMDSKVLRSVRRLANALEESGQTTRKIGQVMQKADEDAARLITLLDPGTRVGVTGAAAPASAAAGAASGSAAVVSSAAAAKASAAATAATDSVLSGTSSITNAPKNITLPNELNNGMNAAWKKTAARSAYYGGHMLEHGGVLVKTKDGKYKWEMGDSGTPGSWYVNYGDVGKNEYVGLGHTHPTIANYTDNSLSDTDISFFFRSDPGSKDSERMLMAQSGQTQYMLARTKEFNKMVEGKNMFQMTAMTAEMKATYDVARAQARSKGASFSVEIDTATRAVARKYNLLYYSGTNGNLTLRP